QPLGLHVQKPELILQLFEFLAAPLLLAAQARQLLRRPVQILLCVQEVEILLVPRPREALERRVDLLTLLRQAAVALRRDADALLQVGDHLPQLLHFPALLEEAYLQAFRLTSGQESRRAHDLAAAA